MKILYALLLSLLPLHVMNAYESAFAKTPVNTIEVKTIPAAHLIAAKGDGSSTYFDQSNALFRPLFRYIQANDIAMTTPVEAAIEPGVMYFYIGEDAIDKAQSSNDEVSVQKLPARMVASIGARGGYSEKNFRNTETALREWLANQSDYTIVGEPRGVFWNGPFIPGIFKRYEVHIPVEKK